MITSFKRRLLGDVFQKQIMRRNGRFPGFLRDFLGFPEIGQKWPFSDISDFGIFAILALFKSAGYLNGDYWGTFFKKQGMRQNGIFLGFWRFWPGSYPELPEFAILAPGDFRIFSEFSGNFRNFRSPLDHWWFKRRLLGDPIFKSKWCARNLVKFWPFLVAKFGILSILTICHFWRFCQIWWLSDLTNFVKFWRFLSNLTISSIWRFVDFDISSFWRFCQNFDIYHFWQFCHFSKFWQISLKIFILWIFKISKFYKISLQIFKFWRFWNFEISLKFLSWDR